LGVGNYNVNGAGGLDTATVSQAVSNFTVNPSASGYTLTSKDGLSVYNLNSVERISFSNEKIAFDVAGTSNAGEVAKILGAVFGVAAVSNTTYAGIGLSYMDAGMSYENLMNLAITAALPGARLTHKAVVDLLFTNVWAWPLPWTKPNPMWTGWTTTPSPSPNWECWLPTPLSTPIKLV
jgi:hypothetical protein